MTRLVSLPFILNLFIRNLFNVHFILVKLWEAALDWLTELCLGDKVKVLPSANALYFHEITRYLGRYSWYLLPKVDFLTPFLRF